MAHPEVSSLDVDTGQKPHSFTDQDRKFVDTGPVTLVSRDSWGAQPPRKVTPLPGGIVKHVLYVYWTDTRVCHDLEECSKQMRDLQNRSFNQNKSDIYYNFMVGGDGKVYEGRGWLVEPDPYLRLEEVLDPAIMTIGFLGDFADIPPRIKQWHASWKILEYGFRNNLISDDDFRMFYCS